MLGDDAAQATRDFFTTSLDRYRKAALKDAPPDARVRLLREFFLSLSTLTEAIMKTLPTRQIEDIRELMQPYFHFEPNHNTFLAKLWRQLSAFLNVSADMSAQRWLLASLNVRGLPSIMSEIQAATAARQPQSISTLGITRSLIDPVVGMPNGNNLATPTFINIPTLNPPLPGFHGATPPLVMSPVMPTVPTVRIFPQKANHLSATPPLTFSHGATPPFAATSLATPPPAQSKTDEDCVVIKTVVRSAAPVQQQTNKATVGRVVLKYGDSPFYSNTASAMDRLMRVVPPQPIRVYREYLAQKDMVVLCTYRKLFQVSEQFTNTFSMKFFSRLGELTGLRLMEDVRLEPSPEGRGQVSWSSIHLFRTIRIVTVGQAKAPSMLSASAGAYAGMLCALCYLQVIPYEMLLALYGSQEIGRDWTDSVLYACRYRFRHLIMLCESLEFLQLSAFRGDLGDPIPDNILELLHRFNHRMRSTGSRFWSAYRVVKIPEGVSMPHPSTYPGTYFRFEQEEAVINWTVVLPEFGIGDPRIIECPLLVEDRYGEQPYEKGMAPVEQQQQCLIRCMITGASNWFCATTQMPMDWVVWLTARDFERRGPCSMWFNPINRRILDTIAEKWNKKLFRTHMLQQETDGNSTPWFHVTSVKFEGLPAFFLQGKGKHVEIGSSMGVSDSFLISSLCLMGIIPMELYSLIRIYGECWIEPVIYACRRRFAQFELLMRNSNFYRLFSQKEARFYHQPPRPPHHNLPVAYEFFQRMRAVATLYWTANPVIVLPKSIPIPESRLSSAYFVFMHSDCEEEWSDMNPALGEVDTYPSVNKNRELENCYTRFHFDTKRWKSTADGVKESVLPAITPLSEASLATVRPSKFTPAALSIIRRFHTELALLAGSSFEATADKKEPNIVARAAFTGEISWLFNRSFVVTEGKMELDCAVSEAEFRLHRFLLRCRILPMGILDFITNNEERLPFVVQSLSGIMMKVVATAKAFLYYEGARPDRVACCQLARDCSMDWRSIRIILPAHLMPTFQEKKFFPSFPVAEQTEDQRTTQALFQELNLHLGAGNKALKSLQEECQPVINTENNRTLARFDSDVDEEEDDVITSDVIPKGIVPWEKEGEETQTTDVMGGYGECPDGDDEYLD